MGDSSGKPADNRRTTPGVSGGAQDGLPVDSGPSPGSSTGRVVHDDRGNAVWDWLKETGRHAIDSTSRLLKKLEAPELEMEEHKDEELGLESDRDPGGGYDPYNQAKRPRGKR